MAGPDVVRFAPALIVSDEQIAAAETMLRRALTSLSSAV
jgi:acetylornithine/N-succinyldiaminopimelate aminotransferase